MRFLFSELQHFVHVLIVTTLISWPVLEGNVSRILVLAVLN